MTDQPMPPASGPPRRSPPTHYVDDAPFDPHAVEKLTPEQEKYYLASQWKLMWWKLLKHKLAVVSGAVLLVMYLSA